MTQCNTNFKTRYYASRSVEGCANMPQRAVMRPPPVLGAGRSAFHVYADDTVGLLIAESPMEMHQLLDKVNVVVAQMLLELT